MKLHLPKSLQTALAAAVSVVAFVTVATGSSVRAEGATYAETYGTNLGTVQFVGDSITHGSDKYGTHNAASWRWAIHKIFADNGIAYRENGYHVGNLTDNILGYVPVYPSASTYGGVDWENRHSAQASGRASELITSNNSRYEGNTPETLVQNYPSDKFFLLIGTNDTLSDYATTGVGAGDNLATFSATLLGCTVNADSSYTFSGSGQMDTIVDTFHKNGDSTAGTEDDAPVVVLSIPTWSPNHGNNNQAADFAAMAEYNKRMKAWSEQKGGVLYVEVNTGLVDVANTVKPGAGVNSMFNDNLHPSGQGDLIIAGNVAKALGYAGRSVGLTRQDAASWAHAEEALSLTSSSGAQTFATDVFDSTNGYTIDFNATFGNGSADGWLNASNALTITVGDGSRGGTLKMSEAYISWGDSILYSRDNSVATEDHLRIAFVDGSIRAEDNVTSGYYVWLGDMLIGEGLSYSSSSFNGISLGVTGSGTGSVSSLSWVNTAYAPTTTGVLDESKAFVLGQGRTAYAAAAESLGIVFTNAGLASGQYATTGKAATGTLKLMQDTSPGSSFFGVVGANHTGDVSIKYTKFTSTLNLFGAINGSLTKGDGTSSNLSVVLDNGVTLGVGTYDGCGNQSIIGTYQQSIAGAFRVEINNATLKGGIIMGIGNNGGTTLSVGSTELYVNDGATVNGNIYGGNYTKDSSNTTIDGDTVIYITGGRVIGSVYGGNKKNGTISGGTSVVITGGYIAGSVNGGNETSGTITGDTYVTVEGNIAHIGGSITADTVTLRNVARNTEGYTDSFDCYAGTITATNLELDHYTAGLMNAKLVTDNLTATNGTVATIRGLQLRNCSINATGATALTLGESVISGNTISYSGDIRLEDNTSFTITNPTPVTLAEEGFATRFYIYKVTEGQQGRLLAADGTALTEDHTATFTGEGDYLEGASFSYDSATGALIAHNSNNRSGNYNIISSTVDYSTINTASTITMSGGQLNLDTDLTSATTAITATGGTVSIASGVTLAQASLIANGATKLAGAGTYALASGSQTMPGNVTLSDGWTGIVKLTGAITDLNLGNAALGKAGSSIELADVTGRLSNGFTANANIILSDSGLTLNNNGYTATYNFNGSISGSGDITRANDKKDWVATLNFKGDVSGWTGDIIMDRANTVALNVNFSDKAKVINASLSVPNWNSHINLSITNSEKVTMNGSLETNENHDNSQMRVTIGSADQATSVDFTNTVHADTLTLVGASTATFKNETTVLHALTATSGTIIVGGDASASLTANDTTSIGTLKMQGAGATATFNGTTTINAIQANGGHGNMQINSKTALTTGSLTIAVNQQGTQLTFANLLEVTGSAISVAYDSASQSGTSVTFNKGFSYTGTGDYALKAGVDTAVTLAGGVTNLENKTIGLATNAELTVANGATLTVGSICNSGTLSNNGTLTVAQGGAFTLNGGNDSNRITTLANSGSVTLSGNSSLSISTLTAAANSSLTIDEGSTVTLSGGQKSTISGTTNITGTLKVDSSSLTFDGGTHTIANLLGEDSANRTGVVTLSNQAAVSAAELSFGARGEKYDVISGSSLSITKQHIKVEAATGAEKATMYTTFGENSGKYSYGLQYDREVIENAKVTLTDTATVKNKLVNAEVVANATDATGANKTVTFDNSDNTLTSVKAQSGDVIVNNANSSAATLKRINAEGGDVTLNGLGSAALSLDTLNIGENKAVKVAGDNNSATDDTIITATANRAEGGTAKKVKINADGITGTETTNADGTTLQKLGEMSGLTLSFVAENTAAAISNVTMQDVTLTTNGTVTYGDNVKAVAATTGSAAASPLLYAAEPSETPQTLTATAVQSGGTASGTLTIDVTSDLLKESFGKDLEWTFFVGVKLKEGASFTLNLGDVLTEIVRNGKPTVTLSGDWVNNGGKPLVLKTDNLGSLSTDILITGNLLAAPVGVNGGNLTLTIKNVPEPTTGTLSVLALAALAARRRRK